MTSLSEAYGGRGRSGVDPRRLYLGVGAFAAGALLVVAGILVAAEVAVPAGYSSGAARQLGGILGGVGVPLVLLGVMAVLPADRNTYAAAVVGAAVMCLGVALFAHAYPQQWVGGPRPELTDLTLPTAGVYFLGAATTLWSVFVGVANFKTRNDPGGTVTMEVTHKGETKVVEVSRDQLGSRGGVGLLGGTPDGEIETQTNRPDDAESDSAGAAPSRSSPPSGGNSSGTPSGAERSDRPGRTSSGGRSGASGRSVPGSPGVSDGGSADSDITSPLDDAGPTDGPESPTTPESAPSPGSPAAREGPGDAYCGNCAEFDYVRTDDGMRPYCGHYDELMDDMEACDDWTPR
ncbi:hypothetical protein PN419_13925 [Halorubrum ezzemoulense]|uniref:DUF7139 domain-containing protein n=1 Tax=Halorubrum ezzemoulense TaxID=337243 RepID=UPI00232F36F3|nr:hypothetical protein [Halorubrum ezzemoulense]MDB9250083.1 hypothetical protein [Halorubrum ezzemoulense]MDB9260251.1 hypothetical protein [Halorubrum ezzemoulense]MDB9263547.1 hypothetical protein [Halorubrum ezzemoulense]MDB9267193.1 hypothetical protein [Halorubrum ezzemoulense]MDB9270612.1 hypothetical protein [Halorubrum ezzemoulense]